MNGPEGASLEYMDRHVRILEGHRRRSRSRRATSCASSARMPGGFGGAGSQVNEARGFLLLAPWGERERTRGPDRAVAARAAQRGARACAAS